MTKNSKFLMNAFLITILINLCLLNYAKAATSAQSEAAIEKSDEEDIQPRQFTQFSQFAGVGSITTPRPGQQQHHHYPNNAHNSNNNFNNQRPSDFSKNPFINQQQFSNSQTSSFNNVQGSSSSSSSSSSSGSGSSGSHAFNGNNANSIFNGAHNTKPNKVSVHPDTGVLDRYFKRYPDGSYEYRYELADGTARYERGYFLLYDNRPSLVVVGYYSYRMPDNRYITVFYNADHNGYRQNQSITPQNYPNLPKSIDVPRSVDVNEFVQSDEENYLRQQQPTTETPRATTLRRSGRV